MDIQERITRQRVQHIVDSYQLDGDDRDAFAKVLTQLLDTYPQSLVELALTEAIVKGWSDVPMQKGMTFLYAVHEQLCAWQPDMELYSQSSTSLGISEPQLRRATSLDVIAADPSPMEPVAIQTVLTPSQFEQITGLDSVLVFDHTGKVRVTPPEEEHKKPREPR